MYKRDYDYLKSLVEFLSYEHKEIEGLKEVIYTEYNYEDAMDMIAGSAIAIIKEKDIEIKRLKNLIKEDS